jgi:methylated-DNA-[protein]-cysteine S-methyltransferase
MRDIAYTYMPSPAGRLLLAGDDEALRFLLFAEGRHPAGPEPGWRPDDAPLREAVRQLEAYFAGELTEFTLPLDPAGTAFQRSVWAALCEIPYGETISYGELARRIGKPQAVRAVGAANGQNPIAIIVPCHRVIGSNGKLTGYGGGLPIKEALLALERKQRPLFPVSVSALR